MSVKIDSFVNHRDSFRPGMSGIERPRAGRDDTTPEAQFLAVHLHSVCVHELPFTEKDIDAE